MPSSAVPVLAAAAAVVVVSLLFAGGWESVPVDKLALHYSGGPIEGQHFQEVVSPGTGARFYGFLDDVYLLPATQQNYIMTKTPEEGDVRRAEYVGAPAADKVVTEWETATYFKLNTDGPVVRRFFEEICVRYECTDVSPGGGWDAMVADTFRQQIVAAIQGEARRYSSDDIYGSREVLLRMQEDIGSTLKDRVNQVLGGEFFCGPGYRAAEPETCPGFTFLIKEIAVPPNVQDQYNQNRASALAVETARNVAAQKQLEGEGEAAKQEALRAAPDLTPAQLGYLRAQAQLECARRPDCVLVVGSDATSIEVPVASSAR